MRTNVDQLFTQLEEMIPNISRQPRVTGIKNELDNLNTAANPQLKLNEELNKLEGFCKQYPASKSEKFKQCIAMFRYNMFVEQLSSIQANILDDPQIKQNIINTRIILEKIQQEEVLSRHMTNSGILQLQLNELITKLEESVEKLPEATRTKFKQYVSTFKSETQPQIVKNNGYIKFPYKASSSYTDLEWMTDKKGDDWVIFNGKDSFKQAIEKILEGELKSSNTDKIHISINLPPQTDSAREQSKHNPDSYANDYALIAFEEAAKQGISPEKLVLDIDGKRIDYQIPAIKDRQEYLKGIVQKSAINILKKVMDKTETSQQTEDTEHTRRMRP